MTLCNFSESGSRLVLLPWPTEPFILFHLLDHEHFDRLTAGHEFKAELIEQRLLQVFKIGMLRVCFIPFEINVEVVSESGPVNDRNSKTTFKKTRQCRQYFIP